MSATLSDDSNIDVRWKPRATQPGGYWIEFATPGADFVKLDAVWPETTTFRHANVASETTFIYRLRSFFGCPSRPAAITTGPDPAAPPSEVEGPLEEPGSSPSFGGVGSKKSIRTTSTIADAAPSALAASLRSVTSVDLRWEDHATDEDGYLVELSQDQRDFKICALLPPNTTSFRKVGLPPDTTLYFRVRAFFYAEPSELVSVTTPAEPSAQGPLGR
jgi:hypothetical protein